MKKEWNIFVNDAVFFFLLLVIIGKIRWYLDLDVQISPD